MDKQYYVYMLTNYNDTVLYVGVTNDLKRRVYEHKNKLMKGFSSKYNLRPLKNPICNYSISPSVK
jgi:putative endonuclease